MLEKDLQNFNAVFSDWIQRFYVQEHQLAKACRYALEGPGKRIRPLLVILSHRLFAENWHNALPAALGVEMVHTYSLVHDDLPILDNDDVRRGRPTVHKVFNDATALLVGDALLSDAFTCLTDFEKTLGNWNIQLSADQRLTMVRELSQAIGSRGMVLGQARDIEWTHRLGYSNEDLVAIHSHKTGKLFAAACAMGAISGGASEEDLVRLRTVGERFGLAYQIMDDLIDDLQGTGKSVGKDRKAGKLTYLSLMSREEAKLKVESLLSEVQDTLRAFGPQSQDLSSWLISLAQRRI